LSKIDRKKLKMHCSNEELEELIKNKFQLNLNARMDKEYQKEPEFWKTYL
jgi:hypothetical protein